MNFIKRKTLEQMKLDSKKATEKGLMEAGKALFIQKLDRETRLEDRSKYLHLMQKILNEINHFGDSKKYSKNIIKKKKYDELEEIIDCIKISDDTDKKYQNRILKLREKTLNYKNKSIELEKTLLKKENIIENYKLRIKYGVLFGILSIFGIILVNILGINQIITCTLSVLKILYTILIGVSYMLANIIYAIINAIYISISDYEKKEI